MIAPSRTYPCIHKTSVEQASRRLAEQRMRELGLVVTYGQHVDERDLFETAPIQARLDDLHAAFEDPSVHAILTVIGGWNANQLLDGIDYDLIRAHPTIFCGYSDITVLNGAFLRQAGMISYNGPHFSTFGMRDRIAYTLEAFRQAFFQDQPYAWPASETWSCDDWFLDQDARNPIQSPGLVVLQEGIAEGQVIGGHLGTHALLHGSPYLPELRGRIAVLESLGSPEVLDRNLQALLHQPGGAELAGVVLGRSRPELGVTREHLAYIVRTKPALRGKPVLYNLDFGHTNPNGVVPIGGRWRVEATGEGARIQVLRH